MYQLRGKELCVQHFSDFNNEIRNDDDSDSEKSETGGATPRASFVRRVPGGAPQVGSRPAYDGV